MKRLNLIKPIFQTLGACFVMSERCDCFADTCDDDSVYSWPLTCWLFSSSFKHLQSCCFNHLLFSEHFSSLLLLAHCCSNWHMTATWCFIWSLHKASALHVWYINCIFQSYCNFSTKLLLYGSVLPLQLNKYTLSREIQKTFSKKKTK